MEGGGGGVEGVWVHKHTNSKKKRKKKSKKKNFIKKDADKVKRVGNAARQEK